MSAPAAESPAQQPGVMRSLEKLGLGATRALSALGLTALLFLAVMTLADGLARWLLNQPIEGVRDVAALPQGDIRPGMPRFSEENWPKNLALIDAMSRIAAREGVTPAQLSAWTALIMKDDPAYFSSIRVGDANCETGEFDLIDERTEARQGTQHYVSCDALEPFGNHRVNVWLVVGA